MGSTPTRSETKWPFIIGLGATLAVFGAVAVILSLNGVSENSAASFLNPTASNTPSQTPTLTPYPADYPPSKQTLEQREVQTQQAAQKHLLRRRRACHSPEAAANRDEQRGPAVQALLFSRAYNSAHDPISLSCASHI
jgi:hypothetical protein